MRLKEKVAIVTGAASGIGRATAHKFTKEGARVVAVDINEEGLKETVNTGSEKGKGSLQFLITDVSSSEQVKALVESVASQYGRIDIIFSNAAIMKDGSVINLTEEDWDVLFAVNVKGAFLLGKYGIPIMIDSGGGSFIITASVNSFYAESDIAGYCATKGATLQLTRAMAVDHGPDKVRVNCICPGWIETPMSMPYLTENPEGREFAGKIAPAGRIGQPEDVAAVASFLASDEANFVTGAAYNVDGGWTVGMTKALALI